MPANGTITLNSKAYSPSGRISEIETWTDRSGSYPNGYGVLSQSIRAGAGTAVGSTKIQWKLKLPKAAAAGGALVEGSVEGVNTCDITLTLQNTLTKATRTELCAQLADLIVDAMFTKSVEDFEPPF